MHTHYGCAKKNVINVAQRKSKPQLQHRKLSRLLLAHDDFDHGVSEEQALKRSLNCNPT